MRRRRRLRVQRGIGLRHPAEPGRPGRPASLGRGGSGGPVTPPVTAGYASNMRLATVTPSQHGVASAFAARSLWGTAWGPGRGQPAQPGSFDLCAHAAVAEAAEHYAQAYAANVTSGQSRQTGPTGAVCLIKDPTPGPPRADRASPPAWHQAPLVRARHPLTRSASVRAASAARSRHPSDPCPCHSLGRPLRRRASPRCGTLHPLPCFPGG